MIAVPRRWQDVTIIQKTALWQAPLIAILSFEIGLFMWLFWAASWGMSFVRRWWLQAPILAILIAAIAELVPVRSADFFILMLVVLLPFTWRLDDTVKISPAGLCPSIFLAGSVFIFQSQFIVLLGVVAWLLSFLLWFATALTGFRLSALSVRWVPILAGSVATAVVIVSLFTLIPRLSTGFIPSFATAAQQIGLTDELEPGGMSDLLASEDVAFRAIPATSSQPAPRYWRVFVLSQQTGKRWRRVADKAVQNDFTIADPALEQRFQILTDTHDLSTVPIPGWPGSAAKATIAGFGYNRYGEALLSEGQDSRKIWVNTSSAQTHDYDYPRTLGLSDSNPRLQAYGRAMRQNYPDERAFIAAMMAEFGKDFIYNTTLTLPKDNALDKFFFEAKTGFCSYFATSLATLLRAGGLEAHVVTGYMGGDWNSFGSYWLVKQSDAHAWVEVRLSDGTWQRLDPTLEAMQLSTPRFSGLASFGEVQLEGRALTPQPETGLWARFEQAVAFVDSLNLRVTLAIMNYGDDATPSEKSNTSEDNFALLLAAIGLAVTIIFVIYALLRLSAFRGRERPVAETRLETCISAYGTARLSGESLLEHVEKIAAIDDVSYERAKQIARQIYQMRFADDGAPLAADKQLMTQIKELAKALKAAQKPAP